MSNSDAKAAGYAAVYQSGLLTGNAFANAHIWRAVEVALTAATDFDDEEDNE